MASLSEVYERGVGSVQSPRRVYLGAGLLAAGALAVIAGIVIATTGIPSGFDTFESRHLAGTLAGIGVPIALIGILTVLPATPIVRVISVGGAAICVVGVALFRAAYPHDWAGYGSDLTFLVTVVYSLGTLVVLGAVFVGLVTLKLRNDPGGTVSLEVVRGGETKTIEVDRSAIEDEISGGIEGFGGVATIGARPDGEVETQTNRPTERGGRGSSDRTASGNRSGSSQLSRSGAGRQRRSQASPHGRSDRTTTGRRSRGRPASDGGAAANDLTSPLDESRDPPPGVGLDETEATRRPPVEDRYCGNCTHFDYVQTGSGMQPFCKLYGTEMTDMDACDRWTSNR